MSSITISKYNKENINLMNNKVVQKIELGQNDNESMIIYFTDGSKVRISALITEVPYSDSKSCLLITYNQ